MTSVSDILAQLPRQLSIGGKWVDAEGGATFAVSNPATGETLLEIADATANDGQAAMDAASDAAESWAATSPRFRADLLRRAFDLMIERADDFATVITLEMGKPIAEAHAEVKYGAEYVRWFSEEAVRISGRFGSNPEGTGRTIVSHHPVGPCYLITPWNFPLAMATRKIAPALAAGNTVVVKPAALTPLTTLFFTQILEEAGLPAGVVNVVTTTSSSKVSAPILNDPRLRKISFTGSTPVGVSLLKQAADNVLKSSMELGGNAPFLVFEDADLDAAVDGALKAKFRNIGQACTAGNRFLVHSSVAEEFTKRLAAAVSDFKMGNGLDEGVTIGPLINRDAVESVGELVQDAVSKGAKLLVGGEAPESSGFYYEATVLGGVPADARILSEEIFGPVLGVVSFDSEDEAIRLANDTEYGLVAYAYTADLARANRLIDRLNTGMLGLNSGIVSNASAPFGGTKQSGLGREGATEGILEYLETKYTFLPY